MSARWKHVRGLVCVGVIAVIVLLAGVPNSANPLQAAQPAVPKIEGTIWSAEQSNGHKYVFQFRKGGILCYTSPTGYFENGTWRQKAKSIYMETNKRFSERTGVLAGNRIERGTGKNVKKEQWTWTATQIGVISEEPSARLDNTIWRIVESDGDHYLFEFRGGTTPGQGVLYYTSPMGYYDNGTWKQDGQSVYVETNKRFSERDGKLVNNAIEGTGKNTKGERWSWKAVKIGNAVEQPGAVKAAPAPRF